MNKKLNIVEQLDEILEANCNNSVIAYEVIYCLIDEGYFNDNELKSFIDAYDNKPEDESFSEFLSQVEDGWKVADTIEECEYGNYAMLQEDDFIRDIIVPKYEIDGDVLGFWEEYGTLSVDEIIDKFLYNEEYYRNGDLVIWNIQ